MDINEARVMARMMQRLHEVAVRIEHLDVHQTSRQGINPTERQAILAGRISLIEPARLREIHNRIVARPAAE